MFPTSALVQHLQADLQRDLVAFLPELILCGAIVGSLLLRFFSSLKHLHLGYFALVCSVLALIVAFAQWLGSNAFDPRFDAGSTSLQLFTGLLVYDSFAIYVRLFLLLFLTLAIWLTLLTGIPDRDDSADFSILLLGSTLGMMMMASANHLLMVFIAVEMASVPSYALAGFLKGKRQGSEGRSQVCHLRSERFGNHALWNQPAGRQVRHRLSARSGGLHGRHEGRRPGCRSPCGNAVHSHWFGLQTCRSAISFLVPGRL